MTTSIQSNPSFQSDKPRPSLIFTKQQIESNNRKNKSRRIKSRSRSRMSTLIKPFYPPNDVCTCSTANGSFDDEEFKHSPSCLLNISNSSTITTVTAALSSNLRKSFTSTTTTGGYSTSSSKRSVSFGTIAIRTYNITISDHPACQNGPSIAFGQDYTDFKNKISVDTYERIRKGQRASSERELYISGLERIRILKIWGISDEEMNQAQDEKDRIQSNRRETAGKVLKKIKRKERLTSLFGLKSKKNPKRNTSATTMVEQSKVKLWSSAKE